jgi:hypothetical protein
MISQLSRASLPRASGVVRALSWASDDRPAQRQSTRLRRLSASMDQLLVGKAFASHAVHKAVQPLQRVPGDVAVIETEGELVNVAVQVLFAGVVIDAMDAALHHGKDAFNAVRGDVIADIFPVAVVHGLMVEEQTAYALIGARFIGMDFRARLNAPMNGGVERGSVGILNLHGDHFAAALAHGEDTGLADCAATSLELLAFVLVLFQPTEIGLVHFDNALKLCQFIAAGLAETAKDKPSRLLRYADFLRQLHRGNALARRHKQIHRVNPLVQRNVRPLENRARAHREIFLALVAKVESRLALSGRHSLAKTAARTYRSFRPETALKVGSRRFHIGKHLEQLECGNGAFGHGLISRVEFLLSFTKARRVGFVAVNPRRPERGSKAQGAFRAAVRGLAGVLSADAANALRAAGMIDHQLLHHFQRRRCQATFAGRPVPAINATLVPSAGVAIRALTAQRLAHFNPRDAWVRNLGVVSAFRKASGTIRWRHAAVHPTYAAFGAATAANSSELAHFSALRPGGLARCNNVFEADECDFGVGDSTVEILTGIFHSHVDLVPRASKAAAQFVICWVDWHFRHSAPETPRRGRNGSFHVQLYRADCRWSQVYNSLWLRVGSAYDLVLDARKQRLGIGCLLLKLGDNAFLVACLSAKLGILAIRLDCAA